MSELEQLIHQRIEQLEAGEPLEICLYGLPKQGTGALRLIAAMRDLPVEEMDEVFMAAQRAAVVAAAAAKSWETVAVSPPPAPASLLAQIQAWFDNLLLRRELAVGLAFIFIAALLGVTFLTLSKGEDVTAKIAPITKTNGPQAEVVVDSPPTTIAAGVHEDQAPAIVEETAPALADVPDTAVVAVTPTPQTAFLPILNAALSLNPQTAALEVVAGIVEIQEADGTWTAVNRLTSIVTGQRIRTSNLSQATLTFYDGSQATLSDNTELTINQLDAQRSEEGGRTIVMTQFVGESEHSVQFRDDGGSHYEVNTPAGTGIVRGTQFRLLVTPGLLAQFAVSEGQVDVTGLNQTVSVVAGQTTAVLAGSPPQTPAFHISGEGEVTRIGPAWIIAGQTFQAHNQTIIMGEPQVGDLVFVEGHLLAEGRRMADRIILRRRAFSNRFTLTGQVSAIAPTVWTVAGQTILVDANTWIDDDIAGGDQVRTMGVILAGGTLQAERIERLEDRSGLPFHFTGIVQTIGSDTWTISGVAIAINAGTIIDSGLVMGELVEVSGRIQEDGKWLARRIVRLTDDLPEFSFSGPVQRIDPWRVAGIAFETREWTAVEPGISIGDRVRVSGVILEDGTWVASTIDRIGDDDDDDDDNNIMVLIGIANSINPWVVNGLQLIVTDDTIIGDDIGVGHLVVVRVQLLAGGTWRVVSIRSLHAHFGLGCFVINTQVIGVQPNQLVLQHWPTLTLDEDDFELLDDVEVNSVVTFPICFAVDGMVIFVGPVIVIYQPVIIIVSPGGSGNSNNNGNNNPLPPPQSSPGDNSNDNRNNNG